MTFKVMMDTRADVLHTSIVWLATMFGIAFPMVLFHEGWPITTYGWQGILATTFGGAAFFVLLPHVGYWITRGTLR